MPERLAVEIVFDLGEGKSYSLIGQCMLPEQLELLRVLAVAPALLKTLEDIGAYTGEGPSTTPWQDIVREVGAVARAATATAKGEQP